MIKIYEKLWFIKGRDKGNLSYMCQFETIEGGEIAPNIKGMQSTGRRWAKKNHDKNSGTIIDNIPIKNIYIGSSVSRWSTSNKLFRVEDPRGFTVEIPTDNIATLHHTTVIKGVQEECVWGKSNSGHILLPINSEPYIDAKNDQNTLDNKLIPVKDLKVGDWVKCFGAEGKEYYFVGRVKITWRVRGYTRASYGWANNHKTEQFSDWHDVEDDKYVNLFLSRYLTHKEPKLYAEVLAKPNIVEVIRNELMEVDLRDIGTFMPLKELKIK